LREGEVNLDGADRLLAAQLGQVSYTIDVAGRVVIQSKKTMRESPDRADAMAMAIWAAAGQQRGERITKLLHDVTQGPPDPLLRGTVAAEQLEWEGRRRGSWRDRLDPDLPTMP
jgi:hypothetical protein